MTTNEMRQMLDRDAELIKNEKFDELMKVYTEDAIMILCYNGEKHIIRGKNELKSAHEAIAKHFDHSLKLSHGKIELLETDDTILVLDQTFVESSSGIEERRATYVFRKVNGEWLCAIDNSYGMSLLDL